MFAYCGNCPICYSDPHGNYRFDIDKVNIADDYDEIVEPVILDRLDIGPKSERAQQIDMVIGEALNSLSDKERGMNGLNSLYGIDRVRRGIDTLKHGGKTNI